jgi:tartrate dehydratase alpha subunit/fumarate hydratase class I-like protein
MPRGRVSSFQDFRENASSQHSTGVNGLSTGARGLGEGTNVLNVRVERRARPRMC